MSVEAPVKLVTGQSDEEFAAEIRAELVEAFKPILAIMNKARSRGIDVQFQLGPDWTGQCAVQNIATAKRLT